MRKTGRADLNSNLTSCLHPQGLGLIVKTPISIAHHVLYNASLLMAIALCCHLYALHQEQIPA